MQRVDENRRMTAEEYLEFEAKAEIKHEFVGGFMFAMAGAGNDHNIITLNIGSLLRTAARETACQVYVSDMKLKILNSENDYYYPDVLAVCDKDDLTTDIKTTACFVIEVLSDGTHRTDRREKLLNYQSLASLQAYVMVSQKKRLVEVYRRSDDDWLYEVIEEGAVELPYLDVQLEFDTIYEDVEGL